MTKYYKHLLIGLAAILLSIFIYTSYNIFTKISKLDKIVKSVVQSQENVNNEIKNLNSVVNKGLNTCPLPTKAQKYNPNNTVLPEKVNLNNYGVSPENIQENKVEVQNNNINSNNDTLKEVNTNKEGYSILSLQEDINKLRKEVNDIEELISSSTESKETKTDYKNVSNKEYSDIEIDEKNNNSEFEELANIELDKNSEFNDILEQQVDMLVKDKIVYNESSEDNISLKNEENILITDNLKGKSDNHQENIFLHKEKLEEDVEEKHDEIPEEKHEENIEENIEENNEEHKENIEDSIDVSFQKTIVVSDLDIQVISDKYTKKQLENFCNSINISKSGSKSILAKRLLDNKYNFNIEDIQHISIN